MYEVYESISKSGDEFEYEIRLTTDNATEFNRIRDVLNSITHDRTLTCFVDAKSFVDDGK